MRPPRLLVVLFAVVACSADSAPNQQTAINAATAIARVDVGMSAQGTALASLDPSQQFAQRGREEAAKLLGIPVDQLTIDKIESVRWRDSSLGCAEPGKVYAQVLTPGIRVALSGAGQKVEVHGDTSGRMVVCRNPTE